MKPFPQFRSPIPLAIALAFIAITSASAWAFPITIDPGSYTGRYSVPGYGFLTGSSTVDLAAGTYTIDTGASTFSATAAAASYFEFTVDGSGNISSVKNTATGGTSAAAFASGSTLTFTNAAITIDPDSYVGRYVLSSHPGVALSGLQTVVLVPDLLYSLDTGASALCCSNTFASYFNFAVDGSGQIASVINPVTGATSASAQPSGDTLSLSTVTLVVMPSDASQYTLSSFPGILLTGQQTLDVVVGLAYGVSSGGQTAYFGVDSTQVTPSTLTIGTVTFALVVQTEIWVSIDIKPGSFPNSINLGSGGTVPVAIFSTASFDAMMVDPLTVTLASAPVRLKGQGTPQASFQDVNADGLLDLVVHVSTEALQLTETDTEAVLEGATLDGTHIRGRDTVRVVP